MNYPKSDVCCLDFRHDDVIKWKHFPRYWPFVRGIHRSPVTSPHKGQWRGALMFSLICVWINGWVNNGEAGDLRCHHAHYDVIVMWCKRYLRVIKTLTCIGLQGIVKKKNKKEKSLLFKISKCCPIPIILFQWSPSSNHPGSFGTSAEYFASQLHGIRD